MINYTDDLNISSEGFDEELKKILNDDIKLLSDLGVKNDRQRNLIFYLDNFCDDICKDFGYEIKDKNSVIAKAFGYLKDLDNINLSKIMAAVLRSLRKIEKKAYPNITGVNEENIKEKRDVNLWIKTLGSIYKAIRKGESRESALNRLTKEWSPMEKFDFEAWARYYEKGDHEKYNIKVAEEIDFEDLFKDTEEPIRSEKPTKQIRPEKTIDDYKKALMGRLNSAERLLNNFVHVWPDDTVKRLYDGLYELKRQLITMRTTSSVQDIIIRLASSWEKDGFSEGANELRKIAQPPNDITSEIEKALKGKEFKKTKPKKPSPMEDMGMGDLPPMEDLPPMDNIPPMEGMEPKGEVPDIPAGVEENLPPPMEEPAIEVEEPPIPEKKPNHNPYSDASIEDALDILEPLAQSLREREFIRDLSKADMMLDALNIASHFPELGEVLAKALELNIYMGTRLEKVISKLKGGVKTNEKQSPSPPNIEMEELSKPEETAFEVTEPPRK